MQKQSKEYDAGTLQALVIVPSRELAMQIVRVAQGLIAPEARATIQQCIGGANPHRQVSTRLLCNTYQAMNCANSAVSTSLLNSVKGVSRQHQKLR